METLALIGALDVLLPTALVAAQRAGRSALAFVGAVATTSFLISVELVIGLQIID